jgi:hypothetical protein
VDSPLSTGALHGRSQRVTYQMLYARCSALVESGLSTLNQCTARPLTESDIPDAVKYNLDLLKMGIMLLETCRDI